METGEIIAYATIALGMISNAWLLILMNGGGFDGFCGCGSAALATANQRGWTVYVGGSVYSA